MVSLDKIEKNSSKWNKIHTALLIYFGILIHVVLIGMVVAFVKLGSIKPEDQVAKQLEQLKQLGKITEMYSSCPHHWTEADNDWSGYMTFTCDRCGTIQTIIEHEKAIYINVEKANK